MDALTQQLAIGGGTVLISVGGTWILHLMQKVKAKLEAAANNALPHEDAVKVNDLLDAIDSLAEAAVQDANSRIVNGLKAGGAFDLATAQSVKTAVVSEVLANLGPLKEKATAAFGSLERVVGQYVEKHVLANKIQSTKATA